MRASAAETVQRYEAIRKRTKLMEIQDPNANETWFLPEVEELLAYSADDWPSVSMAFGGVHVAAWNNYLSRISDARVTVARDD